MQEERLFSYLECREVEEMNQQDKRFLLGTTQEIQKPELPCLLMERTQAELKYKNCKQSVLSEDLRESRTRTLH